MIYEINNFTNGGLTVEEPPKPVTERKGIKVGDFCRGKTEMFIASIKCEVLKIYHNSAMVKIHDCYNKDDKQEAEELNNVAVLRLRDLQPIKGVSAK